MATFSNWASTKYFDNEQVQTVSFFLLNLFESNSALCEKHTQQVRKSVEERDCALSFYEGDTFFLSSFFLHIYCPHEVGLCKYHSLIGLLRSLSAPLLFFWTNRKYEFSVLVHASFILLTRFGFPPVGSRNSQISPPMTLLPVVVSDKTLSITFSPTFFNNS